MKNIKSQKKEKLIVKTENIRKQTKLSCASRKRRRKVIEEQIRDVSSYSILLIK